MTRLEKLNSTLYIHRASTTGAKRHTEEAFRYKKQYINCVLQLHLHTPIPDVFTFIPILTSHSTGLLPTARKSILAGTGQRRTPTPNYKPNYSQ